MIHPIELEIPGRASASAEAARPPLTMLFLCTQNSARSQMAEALLQWKGRGRFVAASAGAVPADAVHPTALGVLAAHGYEWRGRPKGLADVGQERWGFVITLCDRARETCPNLPGQPVYAHWGLPDPAAVEGDEAARVQAFEQAFLYLGRRIDLMLALPLERLERAAAQHRLRTDGREQGLRDLGRRIDLLWGGGWP